MSGRWLSGVSLFFLCLIVVSCGPHSMSSPSPVDDLQCIDREVSEEDIKYTVVAFVKGNADFSWGELGFPEGRWEFDKEDDCFYVAFYDPNPSEFGRGFLFYLDLRGLVFAHNNGNVFFVAESIKWPTGYTGQPFPWMSPSD